VVILIILSFLEAPEFAFLVWNCGIDCSISHTCIFVCKTQYSEISLWGISEGRTVLPPWNKPQHFSSFCWLQFSSLQGWDIFLCHHVQICSPPSSPVDARTRALEVNNLKMTVYLHLVSTSQTHETVHPLSLYSFVSWCLGMGTSLPSTYSLCVPQFKVAFIMNVGLLLNIMYTFFIFISCKSPIFRN
jgi:hypothetical protein